MQDKKKRKPIEMTCTECGDTFIAYSRKALRCPVCRGIVALEQIKRSADYLRGHRKISASERFIPKMTMHEVLKAQKRYNEEHKTYYTYGQFVSMLEGRK